jgi:hypothetical protein
MKPADELTYWGIFSAADTEAAYRNWVQRDDTRRIRFTISITIPTLLIFLVTDYHFFGNSAHFYWLVGARLFFAIASLAVMLRLDRDLEAPQLDRLVLGWDIMAAILVVYIASTRPASFTQHAVINVLTILLTYVLVPLPVLLQAIPAGILSLGLLVLGVFVQPWPDEPVALNVVMSILIANVIGVITSRELNRWKRRQFRALSRETDLRKNLEHALAELKTLRGILPICTHCQRVWNDQGAWEQMETYVRDHTHVEFSHGLCPTCARQHHPEIDWDKKGL